MSVTGNSDNIFVNNTNLKIAKAGKGLIFADGTVLYTANTFNSQNLLANIFQFTNAQTAFVINEVTANTGFAGNTAPTDAISVSSNLFISYTGNLITFGQITAGSVANVESNILSLESNLSDNSSRIGLYESNIHLEGSNVGIGTNSPSANLHVVGNVYATGNINTGDGTSMGIGTVSPSSVLSVVGTSPYSANPTEAGIHIGQGTNGYATIELVGTGSNCLIDFSSPGATEHFYRLISNLGSRNNLEIFAPGNTIALTVDESANVGIGKTNPLAILDVSGTFDFDTGSNRIHGKDTSRIRHYSDFHLFYNYAGTERMRIDDDGDVGIGGSPNRKLFVASGGVNLKNTSSYYLMDAADIYEKSTDLFKRADNHIFQNEAVNEVWMTLTGGNLGIGKTTPLARLEVAAGDNSTVTSGTTPGTFFLYDITDGDLDHNADMTFDGVSIFADGDIISKKHIGSFNGTMSASDERIKSNIQDISDTVALDQLRLLQPKTYNYKDTIKRGKEPVIGFIAQEVKEVIPEAVQKRKAEIPNIYELANVSQSNVITFTNFNTSNLNANSSVINIRTVTNEDKRITLASVIDEHTIQVVEDLTSFTGSVDENGNVITETIMTTYTQEEYDALEPKDGITPDITKEEYDALADEEKEAYTLSYSRTETVNVGDQIFVYGQEVDDFNFLRKETIFTIATAALQEVDRQQQADKERIATLESQVAALLTRVEALENNNP